MRNYLLWWRNLSKESKKELMKTHNIKAITYENIKSIYLETL